MSTTERPATRRSSKASSGNSMDDRSTTERPAARRNSKASSGNSMDDRSRNDNGVPFPEVMYEMVEAESGGGIVFWNKEGDAFTVDENHAGLGDVLAKYFSHRKYTSLQRQLNIYGWKKQGPGPRAGMFQNPFFKRNNKEDLQHIKRKVGMSKRKRSGSWDNRSSRSHGTYSSEHDHSTLEGGQSHDGKAGEGQSKRRNSIEQMEIVITSPAKPHTTTVPGAKPAATKPALAGPMSAAGQTTSNRTSSKVDPPTGAANIQPSQSAEQSEEPRSKSGRSKEKPQRPISNKIVLPAILKMEMIKTWENISQRHLIPTIPARVSVRQILNIYLESKVELLSQQYIEKRRTGGRMSPDSKAREEAKMRKKKLGWRDMSEGIALFFDKALSSRVLYRQEIPQFRLLRTNPEYQKKRMSDLYSCEHLLRLLLKLPDILAECVSEAKRRPILDDMKDFVRFLHQNRERFFSEEYHRFTSAELVAHQKLMRSIGTPA